jgi:hypothetical protein
MFVFSTKKVCDAALPNELTCRLASLYTVHKEIGDIRYSEIAKGTELLDQYGLRGIGEGDGEEIDRKVLGLQPAIRPSVEMRSWLFRCTREHLESYSCGHIGQLRKLVATNLGLCEAAVSFERKDVKMSVFHKRAEYFLQKLCLPTSEDREHWRFYMKMGRAVFYRRKFELSNSPANSSFDGWLSSKLPAESMESARTHDLLFHQVAEYAGQKEKESVERSASPGTLEQSASEQSGKSELAAVTEEFPDGDTR